MCPLAQTPSGPAIGRGSADVIVIGAGVIGLMSALELRKHGLSVRLFDAGPAARESSWAGGGVLCPMPPWRYPGRVWELARRSLELYPGLVNELIEHTGTDPELETSGLLQLDAREQEEGLAWAAREAMEARVVPLAQTSLSHAPEPHGLLLPWVRQVRNPRLCRALGQRAAQLRIDLREREAVTGFTRSGRAVSGVTTAQGSYAAGRVVLCAGAWSGDLAEQLGVTLSIEPVRGQMLLLSPKAPPLREIVQQDGHYLIPRRDGRILVGSTVERAGFDKQTSAQVRERLWAFASRYLPHYEPADVEAHWAGLRPGIRGDLPVIGAVDEVPGLYVNTGHYRNGLAMAPASAELLCAVLSAAPTGAKATNARRT